MPFISVSDEVKNKSLTLVENKFITKYMPFIEPVAVKVYLYALYLSQNGLTEYALSDFAKALNISEDGAKEYFEYLDEMELIAVTSLSPFEIKILDAENIYGAPKKYKPEKYSDFTKSAQSILKGRMISTNEFREYFYLLEEYGFEKDALLMIISYCVNLRGDDIRFQYIKKVAKSFADDKILTAEKVNEKLSAYTSSTPRLIKLFSAAGIKKQPDIDDDRLYKKWTAELGFGDDAIICAAKIFKAKSCEKLDITLEELFKHKKFDAREIEDFAKNKTSLFAATREIAKNLGVYVSDCSPYVENFVNGWYSFGYSAESLKALSAYSFKQGKTSFADMDIIIKKLYEDGIVSEESVSEYIKNSEKDDALLKQILDLCGLTRRVIEWDKAALKNWRKWEFNDEMLFEAARLSQGKSNPTAYMNGILSSWKNSGIKTIEQISSASETVKSAPAARSTELKTLIENHYSELRRAAEQRADAAQKKAENDPEYSKIRKNLNELSIKLAFSEIRGENTDGIIREMQALEERERARLFELNLKKEDFSPEYSCKICGDTGYDKSGNPCVCLKKFISENR